MCDFHGAKAPQVKAKARQRIEEAADRMAKRILGIAMDDDVPPAVALAAAKDALDRAGLKPPTQVDVSVGGPKPWERLVNGVSPMSRAESRARRGLPDDGPQLPDPRALPGPDPDAAAEPEVIDAEVVPDAPVARPPAHGDDAPHEDRPARPTTPGTGLMTMEEAAAQTARANREAGVYPTRVRYPR